MAEPGDDLQLIQAVVRQDPAALMALYDRHGRLAFALAYRILGDPGAAEEAVQDAFMLVWRRAATFDPARGSGVRAWLTTIVHHRAIDLLRKRAGRQRDQTPLDEAEAALASPEPWGEVAERLDRERIRTAVSALPDDQQKAIELAYFDGLSHREIADQTGMPLGTVKGRVRLGLRKLHGLLAEPAPRVP